MAEEDEASKTEDPTERKLGKARDEGQVAQSQELRSWGLLLIGLLGLVFMAPYVARNLTGGLFKFVESPHQIAVDAGALGDLSANLFADIGLLLAPLAILLMIAAVAVNASQFGFMLSWKKLSPKTERFSPIAGAKRLTSARQLVEFVKGMFKMALVSAVGLFVAVPMMSDIAVLPGIGMDHLLDRIWVLGIALVAATVGVLTALAFLDVMYQKFAFKKKMRMTKQEVKDEHKETEGDPQIKARLRRIRMERYRHRMMAAVPEADVVITNPTHYAIALSYKIEQMQAPTLVAKGVDHLAQRIREVAEENDVPIVENPPLARALYATVDLDQEVPYEHYQAVAEVIGYVMKLKGETTP